MFPTSANIFGHPNQATTRATATRSRSIERRIDMPPQGQEKGYGCVVYQDYLILFGSTKEELVNHGGSLLCAYNLKEQRPEEVERERLPLPVSSCTPCFYHKLNGVIFYCAVQAAGRGMGFGSQSQECITITLRIEKRGRGNLLCSFLRIFYE